MTNNAARILAITTQIRSMEARQAELRQGIEQATMDLGRLTFQRWKSRGTGNEPAMAALCHHIDVLNAEYQQLLADLSDARAASASYPSPSPAAQLPFTSYAAASQPSYPSASPPVSMSSPPDAYAAALPSPASLPARPAKPSRECPECYTVVPGSADFCPSCGMRV